VHANRVRLTYSEVSGQNIVATKTAKDSLQCMLKSLKWTVNGSYSNKYQLGSADKIQTYSTQHMLTNLEANSAGGWIKQGIQSADKIWTLYSAC